MAGFLEHSDPLTLGMAVWNILKTETSFFGYSFLRLKVLIQAGPLFRTGFPVSANCFQGGQEILLKHSWV